MKNLTWTISGKLLGVAVASVVGLSGYLAPAFADSESGGVFSVGESESGGIDSVGESESGGIGSVGESQSGGVSSVGESQSGGVYSVGESESGGPSSVGESESGFTVGYGTRVGYVPYQSSWLWRHAHAQGGSAGGGSDSGSGGGGAPDAGQAPSDAGPATSPGLEIKTYTWPSSVVASKTGPIMHAAKKTVTPASKKRVTIANTVPKKEWHVGGRNIKTVRGHAVTSF